MDIRLLAETMKEMSDTAGDHHWLAGVALERQQKYIERLEEVINELVAAEEARIETKNYYDNGKWHNALLKSLYHYNPDNCKEE